MNFDQKIPIAIIGGTGLYNIPNAKVIDELDIQTDWGSTSDKITLVEVIHQNNSFRIAFLPRHGVGHSIPPSNIPQKANMAALKMLGVEHIFAFSAVGSLKEEIAPTHFVLPNQIIDRTRHREDTFYNKGIVVHCSFGDPFCLNLYKMIENSLQEKKIPYHAGEVLICMEGPTFSTRAESKLYKSYGAGIINMTTLPEAKLARELEMSYQVVCMSTDYDSWRDSQASVSADEIMKVVSSNSQTALELITHLIPNLYQLSQKVSSFKGSVKFGIITALEKRPLQEQKKLNRLLPNYF